MVLFPNDTLSFYTRGTPVVDSEGNTTDYAYTLYKALSADVQPLGAQILQMLPQGLSNLTANDKIAFIDLDTGIVSPMKVVSAATGIVYESVQEVPWNTYYIVILRPFQAGQVQ